MEKIGFNLVSIKTEEFAILQENYLGKQKINMSIGLEFKANEKNKQIAVYTSFTFNEKSKTFLIVKVSSHFVVKPDYWDSISSENRIVFPKNFIIHITMLAVGTTRGVLHAKTEGTIFNNFLIPPVDVTKLVKNDLEFAIK